MPVIDQIRAPIVSEMKDFEKKFRASLKSNVALLDKITNYIVKRKGKQMRPMFVFLSAKLWGNVTESTYVAASLIELLHTATLVHDDVVDDAHMRRGFFSINALWKNKIAVLVGDFLLSRGLILSVENQEYELLKLVTRAVKEMSEGELLQMEKTRGLNLNEEVYFEIIRQKTAVLIAACCASGIASVGGTKEQISTMWDFGEKVGIAFQIKDDLLDYGLNGSIGKPTGIDIQEKKVTLPLLHTINQSNKQDRKWMINTIKRHNTNKEKVERLIDRVVESGGVKYAEEKMNSYFNQAKDMLSSFPDNEARKSLELLLEYTVNRSK